MTYTTLHLHNVPADREADYAEWFDGPHREKVGQLRGFKWMERFEVTPEQIMVDIPQPWKFLSIYDFDYPTPEIDLPALGPHLAEARDAGMIELDESERIYTWRLYDDWRHSDNWDKDQPYSGIFFIPGNYIPGKLEEYHEWYDETHIPEVSAVPGMVGMRRGELSPIQIEPKHYCPGDQLVMAAQQTDDLGFTIRDFGGRALGTSPSGISMETRSSAASTARTVHFFRKISGDKFWSGGIAYSGDLSVYPDKQ